MSLFQGKKTQDDSKRHMLDRQETRYLHQLSQTSRHTPPLQYVHTYQGTYSKPIRRQLSTMFSWMKQEPMKIPDQAIRSGLLRQLGKDRHRKTSYRHDKVQHLAYDILPPKESRHPRRHLSDRNLYEALHPAFYRNRDWAFFHRIFTENDGRIPFVKRTKKNKHITGHAFIVWTQGHWVAIWQDVRRKRWYYFDSEAKYKMRPSCVKRAQRKARRRGYRTWHNRIPLQTRPGECGMFVIYFILHALKRLPMQRFNQHRYRQTINDETMNRFHHLLFKEV